MRQGRLRVQARGGARGEGGRAGPCGACVTQQRWTMWHMRVPAPPSRHGGVPGARPSAWFFVRGHAVDAGRVNAFGGGHSTALRCSCYMSGSGEWKSGQGRCRIQFVATVHPPPPLHPRDVETLRWAGVEQAARMRTPEGRAEARAARMSRHRSGLCVTAGRAPCRPPARPRPRSAAATRRRRRAPARSARLQPAPRWPPLCCAVLSAQNLVSGICAPLPARVRGQRRASLAGEHMSGNTSTRRRRRHAGSTPAGTGTGRRVTRMPPAPAPPRRPRCACAGSARRTAAPSAQPRAP